MDSMPDGVINFSPVLLAQTVAVLVGAAALGIGAFLYATNRTALLRNYLGFLAAIFLFVLSFWFREIKLSILTLTATSPGATVSGARIARGFSGAAFLAEAIGGIALVLVLPHLTHGLFNRSVPPFRKVIALASALVMAALALLIVARPLVWAQIVLMSLMYATVASSIAELGIWIGRRRNTNPVKAKDSSDSAADPVAAIKVFLVLSAVFLPLFILDVVISAPDAATWAQHPIVRAVDNLSVPLYFIILAVGSVVFAYRYLNEPALIAEDCLTEFGRTRYKLTDREAEVVEYIMEGFSVADTASAMKISPKTVENHLYNAYQKTGVTNRIQLFNLFENRRRL
jgi:DNA-binding CsgD family transcriptional regulator